MAESQPTDSDSIQGTKLSLPKSVYKSELNVCGVTLRVHVLDDGRRVIDAADIDALFQAWAFEGARWDEDDLERLCRWAMGDG
jgi:hypothetical protein